MVELLPFDEYVASLDRKRNSAAAVMYAPDGRILLVEPSYKEHFDLPGGAVEAGEPPWRAVAREVREELGLDRWFGPPVLVDYTSGGALPEGLAWVFDGGLITEREVRALTLTDPEVTSVGLYTSAEAAARTPPRLFGRIQVALQMAAEGGFALCEDGRRVLDTPPRNGETP